MESTNYEYQLTGPDKEIAAAVEYIKKETASQQADKKRLSSVMEKIEEQPEKPIFVPMDTEKPVENMISIPPDHDYVQTPLKRIKVNSTYDATTRDIWREFSKIINEKQGLNNCTNPIMWGGINNCFCPVCYFEAVMKTKDMVKLLSSLPFVDIMDDPSFNINITMVKPNSLK